jgi:putative spermidine/putrescine transport system ATP-binding protein
MKSEPIDFHMNVTAMPAAGNSVKMHAAGLSKHYGEIVALHPIDLEVRTGELLTLLGPSGSGKTTLLQLICGLTQPSSGKLFIDGHDRTSTPAHERDIGVVFQSYALFPHLTVFENIAFPLQMRRVRKDNIKQKIHTALEMVGLATFGERFPRELSGGQQQRVALARCLVYQPSLILMDESLSALDRKLRENMQIEIKRIHREIGSTIIFVTHDQEEALALSDRVCLMKEGRIEQVGTPADVYERPDSSFVADFIGISNMFRGTLLADGRLEAADGVLPLPPSPVPSPAQASGSQGVLVVRPEHMTFVDRSVALLNGSVAESIYAGSETRLLVELASGALVAVRQPSGAARYGIGEPVSLSWEIGNSRFLER